MENNFSEKDSLLLINQMLNKAKNSYIDTGVSAMLWGATISGCSLLQFLQLRNILSINYNFWWLTLAALAIQFFVVWKEKKINQAKYYDEKFLNSVWATFGFLMFVVQILFSKFDSDFSITFTKVSHYTKQQMMDESLSFNIQSLFNGFVLLIYAFPTIVTGWAKNLTVMLIGGLICVISSIAVMYTTKDIDMLLIALSAATSWLVPGILLNKKYRKTIANV